ncbi:hypothetical protein F0562_010946 [Nyssa sinensis]|uniref:Protein kinase domain-containing protein n=1 Tax=Nyssa sinensis TaxID=561372 RepID=A0A5J5A0H6_9ASTE|nr:hypothetical protein F0562_010946 [Nyssa sinensis]
MEAAELRLASPVGSLSISISKVNRLALSVQAGRDRAATLVQETNISNADELLQGRDEVEIHWHPPALEPLCNSSTDCNDWPNSNCSAGRCHCIPNYLWNGSLLNCTQESVLGNSPNQSGVSRLKPKEKSIPLKAVVISIIVVVAILLLCGTSYITYKRKMRARRQESRESLQGNPVLQLHDSERRVKDLIDSHQLEEDDKAGIDVPYFELESILAATNNFSDVNKLGQGGFGPVYKVTKRFVNRDQLAIMDKRTKNHHFIFVNQLALAYISGADK